MGAFAKYRGTAQWIDETENGSPRRYESSAAANFGLLDNQTVVDIFVRSGHHATGRLCGGEVRQTGTHFSLLVVNAEAAYSEAIETLRMAVTTKEPQDDDAPYDIQVLKDAVAAAGWRASSASTSDRYRFPPGYRRHSRRVGLEVGREPDRFPAYPASRSEL